MKKEFIPYEEALELKELGFDESCFEHYLKNGDLKRMGGYVNYSMGFIQCIAPLYQQVFRWFREEHGLWSEITKEGTAKHNILYSIWDYNGLKSFMFESKEESYEKAELACLRKLIEIVKKK